MAEPLHLTDQDVALVLRAISEGRVRTVRGVPYDPGLWNEEAVRDWLERTHQPRRARQILVELAHGDTVRSRSMAPTVEITLQPLLSRIDQLEREVAALKANSPRPESPRN